MKYNCLINAVGLVLNKTKDKDYIHIVTINIMSTVNVTPAFVQFSKTEYATGGHALM